MAKKYTLFRTTWVAPHWSWCVTLWQGHWRSSWRRLSMAPKHCLSRLGLYGSDNSGNPSSLLFPCYYRWHLKQSSDGFTLSSIGYSLFSWGSWQVAQVILPSLLNGNPTASTEGAMSILCSFDPLLPEWHSRHNPDRDVLSSIAASACIVIWQ